MLNQNLLLTGDNGYNLTKSLRFRSSASAYLNRTPSSTGNRQIWTWSAWVKRGTLGTYSGLFGVPVTSSTFNEIRFTDTNTLSIFEYDIGTSTTFYRLDTTQVFRDPSAWYHIVFAFDSTQATSSNRCKLYVNGVQVIALSTATYPSQNYNTLVNTASVANQIGMATNDYFDGYQAEVNFIDGQQLTPSSFGSTNALTGVWQPAKYTGTYGTNGFYLPFTDNSATTPVGLGKDFSGNTGTTVIGTTTSGSNSMTVVSLTGIAVGNTVTGLGIPTGTYVTAASVLTVTLSQNATSSNVSQNYNFAGNNWTCNNISLTAGSTYDSMTDVPTLTSATTANYCVWNPLSLGTNITTTNGNLTAQNTVSESNHRMVKSTFGLTTGKWYWELNVNNSANVDIVGLTTTVSGLGALSGYAGDIGYGYNTTSGAYYANTGWTTNGTPSPFPTSGVINIAYDADAGKIWFGSNGTWFNSGSPSTGANAAATYSGTAYTFVPALSIYANTGSWNLNCGQRPFSYTPPTGFVALNTFNLPEPSIKAGNKNFNAVTYTGNGTAGKTVTGVGFQPDFTWIKSRSDADSHYLVNNVAGYTKYLLSNSTQAEVTNSNIVTSSDSDGFTVGSSGAVNGNTATYVAWNWKAGNSAGSSNTAGSITSTVSANPTAGFSVVTYTGNNTLSTVGHGLGASPKFIIVKTRSGNDNWVCYHGSLGVQYYTLLNTTASSYNNLSDYWSATAPSSSVFGINAYGGVNTNGATYVAYCFAEVAGYSKFGSYTGNGSTDGAFVHLGFRPKFVMIKISSGGSGNWEIFDTSRNTYNQMDLLLLPSSSAAESNAYGSYYIDATSNGFKVRGSGLGFNGSGETLIYAAFAENPQKYALAR